MKNVATSQFFYDGPSVIWMCSVFFFLTFVLKKVFLSPPGKSIDVGFWLLSYYELFSVMFVCFL